MDHIRVNRQLDAPLKFCVAATNLESIITIDILIVSSTEEEPSRWAFTQLSGPCVIKLVWDEHKCFAMQTTIAAAEIARFIPKVPIDLPDGYFSLYTQLSEKDRCAGDLAVVLRTRVKR